MGKFSKQLTDRRRLAMRKKTIGKSSPQKATTRRKLSDLAPRRVRGGDASSVKGGRLKIKIV